MWGGVTYLVVSGVLHVWLAYIMISGVLGVGLPYTVVSDVLGVGLGYLMVSGVLDTGPCCTVTSDDVHIDVSGDTSTGRAERDEQQLLGYIGNCTDTC